MGATNGLGLPFPELTEMADGPDALSDLANATEDYVYDRILPGGVTRYPTHYWGSGTTFPTTANGVKSGDEFYHSGLLCVMKFIGSVWRQSSPSSVANRAALLALSTNYASALHDGFRVLQTDMDYEWVWDTTKPAWRFQRKINGENPAANASRGGLAWGVATGLIYGWVNQVTRDAALFEHVTGTGITSATMGGIKVLEEGRYSVTVTAGFDCPTACQLAIRPYFQNVAYATSSKTALIGGSTQGAGTSSSAAVSADVFWNDDYWLAANQLVGAQMIASPAGGSTLNYCYLAVQRIG